MAIWSTTSPRPCLQRGLLCVLAAVAVLGCKQETPPSKEVKPAVPVDRLAKDELRPGQEKVFGLVTPRDMTVSTRHQDSALLVGEAKPEEVANYIRRQVSDGPVEIGASRTMFTHVRIGEGEDYYRIEVIGGKDLTKVWIFREATPAPSPLPPEATDADRWRAAGRNPDGTVIDRLKQY